MKAGFYVKFREGIYVSKVDNSLIWEYKLIGVSSDDPDYIIAKELKTGHLISDEFSIDAFTDQIGTFLDEETEKLINKFSEGHIY